MWQLASRRDRISMLAACATVVCVVLAFLFSKGTQFLMPGPLSSAHGAVESCNACHAKSGSGKLSWVHGLAPGEPLADSKACLACHKMPDTAFNAHGASTEALVRALSGWRRSLHRPRSRSRRGRRTSRSRRMTWPRAARCATCHQEHQGAGFNLSKMSNEQCRSCHVVRFDSFDGHHPKFEGYLFKRRTRIVYDHAGHFGNTTPRSRRRGRPSAFPRPARPATTAATTDG